MSEIACNIDPHLLKIKQKVSIVNSVITKTRSKQFKFNIEKYKKSKIVFDAIKKKKWDQATKLASNDRVLKKIIDWNFIYQNNSPKFSSKTSNFIKKNSNWPAKKFFRKKMELFIDSNLNNKKIIQFFEENPPLTTKGAVNYVDALRKENGLENVKDIARKTWVTRKFTKRQSKDFYKKYKKILNVKDHLERIERLTWIGRSYEARRMLPLINKSKKNLYNAKIILRRRAGNADHAVSLINKELLNDPGLIYERLRWRRKNKLYVR